MAPWEEVMIDLVGPWRVKVNNRKSEINTLTCNDTASNLVELIGINNKTSHHTRGENCPNFAFPLPMPSSLYTQHEVMRSSEVHSNGSSIVLKSDD
jgi:hypothetical protein